MVWGPEKRPFEPLAIIVSACFSCLLSSGEVTLHGTAFSLFHGAVLALVVVVSKLRLGLGSLCRRFDLVTILVSYVSVLVHFFLDLLLEFNFLVTNQTLQVGLQGQIKLILRREQLV